MKKYFNNAGIVILILVTVVVIGFAQDLKKNKEDPDEKLINKVIESPHFLTKEKLMKHAVYEFRVSNILDIEEYMKLAKTIRADRSLTYLQVEDSIKKIQRPPVLTPKFRSLLKSYDSCFQLLLKDVPALGNRMDTHVKTLREEDNISKKIAAKLRRQKRDHQLYSK